ncbi:MAG: NAD(P)H-hydrate dehydratase [Actinomycetota bacterium]
MRPLLTPEEMAAADKATIDAGTPVEVLMDRAGAAVARAAIRMLGGRYGKKVVVVCGKGNNGGDGYAAARVLKREGLGVRCLAVVDPGELKGAAREHYERAVSARVSVDPFDEKRLQGVDLVVDAIFGTGFRTPTYDEKLLGPINAIQRLKEGVWTGESSPDVPRVLAIDIPSGLDGNLGPVSGAHVIADRTIAIAAEKAGTFLAPPQLVGEVEVVDIGIHRLGSPAHVLEPQDVERFLPTRRSDFNKRSTGAIAVFAGSDAMTGAAALVVQGAMRAGSGYVTLACTERVAGVVQARCPEALVRVTGHGDHLDPQCVDDVADVLDRARVVAIGPGLGVGDDQRQLVRRLLAEFEGPIVVDADGLNVLVDEPDLLAREKGDVIITPHPGELARLLERDAHDVDRERLMVAVETVKRFGCQLVLKGFRSVIAAPAEDAVAVEVFLNPTAGPELATAGTGDVLTGATAAFIGANPREWRTMAVAGATFVHGLAGSLAKARASESGVVAWDVAEALPEAVELIREGVS